MSWPPESGTLLPNTERAYGLEEKLAGYSLKLGHVGRGQKAEGFERVLAITLPDLGYLVDAILDGIRTMPMSGVRLVGRHGVHCEVIVPVRGLRDRAHRTANVLTAWELRSDGDAPRLITAYIVSTVRWTMAPVKHAIEEHDVVAMRESVDAWPAGTTGTVVSMYDDAALVEMSWDEPPESILDYLVTVPFEQLELRWSHRTGDVT